MRSLLVLIALFCAAIVLFAIGALSPSMTRAEQFLFNGCILPSAENQRWQHGHQPIHEGNCLEQGIHYELAHPDHKKAHNPATVVFYLTLPVKRTHRTLSRWHQYLMGDLDVVFTTDEFPRELYKLDQAWLWMEVALYYRDNHYVKWRHLASSNITRVLDCRTTSYDYFFCDHLPLFELGSVHYDHYLINIRFPSLPLGHKSEYEGLFAIDKLNLFEIHQSRYFTEYWFVFKIIVFPLSVISLLFLLRRISKSTTRISLIQKALLFLNCTLVLYNLPIELLTLWVDLPWMLVFGDFRQVLFMVALLVFWVVYIGEHAPSPGASGHIGKYWKQILVAGMGILILFVYEFCERGVQVINPFFTLWGSTSGRRLANCFLIFSLLSMLVYLGMLLHMIWRVYTNMRQRLSSSEDMTTTSRDRIKSVLSELKYFLLITLMVAVLSVCGYVLPTEIFLLHDLHGNTDLSLYGALIFGNYGMWNLYTFLMTVVSPSSVSTASTGSMSGDLAAAYNVMIKTSHE